MEKWIKTYCSDDYEVSSLGRVRSLDRFGSNNRFYKGRIKKLTLNQGIGYFQVSITVNGKSKLYYVHQLVYYSFNGGEPNGHALVVDHIDKDKQNNTLNNLRLVSQYDNLMKGSHISYDLPKHITASPYKSGGLVYIYQRRIDGTLKSLKRSININKVLEFKKQYENKGNLKWKMKIITQEQ